MAIIKVVSKMYVQRTKRGEIVYIYVHFLDYLKIMKLNIDDLMSHSLYVSLDH